MIDQATVFEMPTKATSGVAIAALYVSPGKPDHAMIAAKCHRTVSSSAARSVPVWLINAFYQVVISP